MSLVQEFSIGVARVAGRVVIVVRGDLDAATSPRLRAAFDDLADHDRDDDLVVDMGGLTLIDSSGIYVLIQALKLLRSRGRALTLIGTSPGAYKVLDVCGLTSVFECPSPYVPTAPLERERPEGVGRRWL